MTLDTDELLSPSELKRAAELQARRDALIVFLDIALSAEPVSLVELCGRYRVEPDIMRSLVRGLISLGAIRGGGNYAPSAFGARAFRFMAKAIEGVELPANQARSAGAEVPEGAAAYVCQPLDSVIPTTNNGTLGTITIVSYAVSQSDGSTRKISQQSVTEIAAEELRSTERKIDAAPSNNYL